MVSKETAQRYAWGDACDGWHLVRDPGLSVIQERMPPGAAEVRHAHRHAQQFFFVLRGTLTIQLADRTEVLAPSQGLHLKAGMVHRVRNDSADDVEFLVVSQPPTHGDRVVPDDPR
jgi:mannose-6-phosphate isomerase-like protein (cupin superfamily)